MEPSITLFMIKPRELFTFCKISQVMPQYQCRDKEYGGSRIHLASAIYFAGAVSKSFGYEAKS